MTDEIPTMEKKVSASAPSKNQDVARSRQDGTISNAKSRAARPRESSGGSVGSSKSRAEGSSGRKPMPQKSKAMDKRPRPRGGGQLQPVTENSDQYGGPEMGSLQAPGSKKQNLNHLLNFHFAPRENRGANASWRSFNSHPGGGWRARNGSGALGARPKFSKENFLQANCQFLVRSAGDYSAHAYNPDRLVEWDLVEQIHIRVAGEFPSCPICLSPPSAAKMTKCGHIFCWPCLLHYLALSDNQSRKCPICYEQIAKEDLKSVVSTQWNDAIIGEEVEMQLMFRKKGVFQAMPLMCRNGAAFDWETLFAKFIMLTPEQVDRTILQREYAELQERFEEEKGCPEVCFVEQAFQELETRKSNTCPRKTTVDAEVQKLAGALNLPNLGWNSEDSVQSVDGLLSPETQSSGSYLACDDQEQHSETNDDFFYFYQAIHGENIFLHPLNMAMLWKAFGNDPIAWPQVLQLRVIDKENVVMMDDMRKRLKFLNHLPITTGVQLVEVDLKQPIISADVEAEFSAQVEARKKKRIKRAKDEKRRERKHEEEERKRNMRPCPQIGSIQEFPAYDYDEGELDVLAPLMEDAGQLGRRSDDDDRLSVDSAYSYSSSPGGFSFAKVASQPSSSAGTTSVVWGRPVTRTVLPTAAIEKPCTDGEGDPEEASFVPTYRMSMSDAIAKAFANVQVQVKEESNNPSGSNAAGKKKGRKNKGKVLFATGMDI